MSNSNLINSSSTSQNKDSDLKLISKKRRNYRFTN